MGEGALREAGGAGRPERVRDFQDLDVWKKGRVIAGSFYKVTGTFPPQEMFGLSSQVRRSAVSITSNIAEGFNPRGSREFQRFVPVALGSCAELRSLLRIAADQQFVASTEVSRIQTDLNSEERMLGALQRSLLRRSPPGAQRPTPRARRS